MVSGFPFGATVDGKQILDPTELIVFPLNFNTNELFVWV
jgi:hypothetical protein